MTTKKLNFLCLTIATIFGLPDMEGQITFSPDPESNAVCPNINVQYTINNYIPACHDISDVVGGAVINDGNSDDNKLTVNWFDNGFEGRIVVTRTSTTGECANAAASKTVTVPIRTLVGLTPTITGPSPGPQAGFINTVSYTASLNYPFRGTNDPSPLPVPSFDWTLPAGWTNNSTPPTSATISVTTNIGGGGTVTAVGRTTCGAGAFNSLPANMTASRTLSTPCPIIPDKTVVRCGEPEPNNFVASNQPAGYASSTPVWSWSLPVGWAFSGPSNSRIINVNMDGQHGGNVVATFSDYGISASCPLNIPLIIVNPGSIVNGNDKLCETQNYALSSSLPQPTGSSFSWAVSPPNAAVSPLNGNGTVATLTPTNSGNSTPGAEATITFTSTGCGLTETIEKTFFVGKPDIVNHRINGFPGQSRVVCPGWHNMGALVLGDDTDPFCMTWELVNNNGLPPHTLYDVTCSSANIFMNPANQSPATIRVTATNECGAFQSFFYLYPYSENCKELSSSIINIYPNPTKSVLNIEATTDNGEAVVSVNISSIQLIDMMGHNLLKMDKAQL